jgi:hypothetical protein
MKFVMAKSEVAEALLLTVEELDLCMVELQLLGFPLPVAGLGDRWSIIDVINWVNREQPGARLNPLPGTGARAPVAH